MTPYYEGAGVTIYHGDCREVLWNVEADIAVTDPPYGIGKARWDKALPIDALELMAFRTQAAAIFPGVWNIGRMPQRIGPQEYAWTLCAHLTNGMTRGAAGFGNWIPCMLYSRTGVSMYRPAGDAKDLVVGTEEKPDHPSPKPYRVMTWVISRVPDGSIIDPFMGSGTTLAAAKQLGRRAIGIEVDERYCEMAATRLGQEVLNLGGVA